MAFIYNLTDSWNDVATTWNGIKLAVTDTGSSATSKLLNLTISGSSTGSFTVDKSGNLLLSGSVNKITMTAPATGATLTLADNSTFITSGAYSSTFTFTGATTLTFPTSGTVTALGNTTTGSGSIVLATSPTLSTPALGTPSSVNLTNAVGLPISTGLTGTGTGVLTALAVNVGSAGAFVTFNGALGTPSSGNLSNCTGISPSNISGLGTGVATWLATPSSANLAAAVTGETGSGALVFATTPTLVTPILGTPTSVTLTNATGLPLTTGVTGTLPVANGGTGITSFGTGVATALGQNVTGSGGIVLSTSPTLVTPILGTPTSVTLTNATGLPLTTGVTGTLPVANGGTGITSFGTGVATALGVNVGSAGAFVVNGGALGTPSSGTLTNATGLPISTGVSGLGTGVATFLATPSSANLASAVTDETGSGSLVFATDPVFPSDVTVGVASSAQGELILANTSANTVKLRSSNSTAANYTLTFPAAAPVNGYYLQTDTNGVLSWAAGGGGGGGSPGGSNTQVQFNDAATFGGAAAFTYDKTTYTLGLGVASTTTGIFNLYNSASANAVSIKSGNNSAAWSLTLPTSAGTNGQYLQTDGSGNASWTTVATGLTVGSTAISGGTSGRILYDNAGVLGEYSVIPVSLGGTNATSASITAFNNITGYTASGATGTTSTNLVFSTSPTITTPTISGNETHTGTGALFLADFSNATVASRFAFATSTTNGSTGIYALPNGTSTAASWQAANAADPTNCSKILIATNASTDVQLVSGINGTGTYLPLSIYTNGGQSAQFSTTKGTFTLGVAGTAQGILNLTGATSGTVSVQGAAAAGTWTLTLPTTGGTANYALTTNGSGVSSWSQISLTAGVTGVLPVANGGTNSSSAGITAFNNITGYTASGATGTTSTNLVFSTSPTLVTPILGTPQSGTLTNCTGLPLTTGVTGTLPVANGGTGLTSGTSGGVLYYSATGTLASSAALAASALVIGGGAGVAPSTTTTGAGILTFLGTPSSANLAAAVTDETGSGSLVFATSPSLTTPTLGVASATSINKVAITAPATSATLTIANGKTLTASNTITLAGVDGKTVTFNNSITFAGTDSTTMTFPSTSSSIGYLNIPQNSQSAAYALAIGDVGKHISISSGGVTVNASIFSAGDVVTIFNNSGSNQTITQGTSVTMYQAGTANTGHRTLAQRGVCTVLCVASNTFVISGAGLS